MELSSIRDAENVVEMRNVSLGWRPQSEKQKKNKKAIKKGKVHNIMFNCNYCLYNIAIAWLNTVMY